MSLDQGRATGLDAPVGGVADLVAYVRSGEKPREAWRVGTEHEKLGLLADTLRPVPYEGERGICALLDRIAEMDGWDPIREGSNTIALLKGGANISLEPGGQLELSGAPLRTIHEICREFHTHLELVRSASEPANLVWLALGIQPLHTLDQVTHVPKERYRIMREYLPSRGELALEMMHLTATVQANLDYSDEADMVAKMRMSLSVSPIVSALFANSSLSGGKPSGLVSKRLRIWRHTDPDRTGLLPFVFEDDFGYERYVEWALDVPMFFILREGRYLAMRGRTFRQFLTDGHEGHHATLGDFDRHLTTLFPEVRLKRVIEVRGADAVPPGMTCSLPALWKGLFYDESALAAARDLVRDWGDGERNAALEEAARHGLSGAVPGAASGAGARRRLLDLARELVDIAAAGLGSQRCQNADGRDEALFLDPLREQLERGLSPGQVVLQCWEGEWQRSARRLIEYARY